MYKVKGINKNIKDELIGKTIGKERAKDLIDIYLARYFCDSMGLYLKEKHRIEKDLNNKGKAVVGEFILERKNK